MGREGKYNISNYREFSEENGYHPFGSEIPFMIHSQVVMGTIQKRVATSHLLSHQKFCEERNIPDVWIPENVDKLKAAATHNFKAEDLNEITLEGKTNVKACIRSMEDVLLNIARTPRLM